MMEEKQAPEQETESAGGDEDLSGIVRGVSDNLTKMQSLLAEEGVPQELTDRLGKLNDDYQALLQDILASTNSSPDAEAKPPGGMVDANAGRGGKPLPP